MNGSVTVREDITLISLIDSPANINAISDIFEKIAKSEIDVDMISQIPPNGKYSSLSFTVSGEDFGKILKVTAELREKNPNLKISVSSGNCKISVYSEEMRERPGIAAKVFRATSSVNADVRMITTSETDISLLIFKADLDNTLNSINKIL